MKRARDELSETFGRTWAKLDLKCPIDSAPGETTVQTRLRKKKDCGVDPTDLSSRKSNARGLTNLLRLHTYLRRGELCSCPGHRLFCYQTHFKLFATTSKALWLRLLSTPLYNARWRRDSEWRQNISNEFLLQSFHIMSSLKTYKTPGGSYAVMKNFDYIYIYISVSTSRWLLDHLARRLNAPKSYLPPRSPTWLALTFFYHGLHSADLATSDSCQIYFGYKFGRFTSSPQSKVLQLELLVVFESEEGIPLDFVGKLIPSNSTENEDHDFERRGRRRGLPRVRDHWAHRLGVQHPQLLLSECGQLAGFQGFNDQVKMALRQPFCICKAHSILSREVESSSRICCCALSS